MNGAGKWIPKLPVPVAGGSAPRGSAPSGEPSGPEPTPKKPGGGIARIIIGLVLFALLGGLVLRFFLKQVF